MTDKTLLGIFGIALVAWLGVLAGATLVQWKWSADEITKCQNLPEWCAEELPRLNEAING